MTDPSSPKLCKDCNFYTLSIGLLPYPTCLAKATQDLVTGEQRGSDCYVMRGRFGGCGPKGELWQPQKAQQPIEENHQ